MALEKAADKTDISLGVAGLTWCLVSKSETHLMETHDVVEIRLGIQFAHCQPVTILDRTIIEHKTYHLALLQCSYRYDYFGHYYRL